MQALSYSLSPHLEGAGQVGHDLGEGHILPRLHNLNNAQGALAVGGCEERQHDGGVHPALLRLAGAQIHLLAVLLHVARHLRLRMHAARQSSLTGGNC